MDDFVISNLHESRNEWCTRLVSILTPLVIGGLRSIFNEAWKLCTANDEMNKLKVTEPKGMSSLGLTKFDWVFYPRILLERDSDISGFKIVDSNVPYQKGGGIKFEKGKTLVILRQDRKQKDLDYWKKKLPWEKTVHSVGFQFVDLDDDEYTFLKPFENKFKNKNYSVDMMQDFINNGYGGLFETEKRKAYPINRFQTYLTFEE